MKTNHIILVAYIVCGPFVSPAVYAAHDLANYFPTPIASKGKSSFLVTNNTVDRAPGRSGNKFILRGIVFDDKL